MNSMASKYFSPHPKASNTIKEITLNCYEMGLTLSEASEYIGWSPAWPLARIHFFCSRWYVN